MNREDALNKTIGILTYHQVNFCKSKEAVANMNEIIEALEKIEQEPCDDCISRQAVLDLPRIKTHNVWGNVIYESVDVENVRQLPSVTPQPNKWIPCSERLPEVGSEVLVCFDFKGKRSVYISHFYGDGEFHGLDDEYLTTEGRKYRKAVAWMTLPEPYKSEIPTGQIAANGELYPGEFDDPLAEEGSDKE